MPNDTKQSGQNSNDSPVILPSDHGDTPPMMDVVTPTPVNPVTPAPVTSQGSAAPTNDILDPLGQNITTTTMPKKKFASGKIIATILGLFLLVGGIGAGVYLSSQNQNVNERAYSNVTTPPTDTCNMIQVTATDNGACPKISGTQKNNVSTYNTTYTLKNITTTVHQVAIKKSSNFCTEPFGQTDPNLPNWPVCYSSDISTTEFITIQPNETKTVTINRSSDRGASCGSYQTDLYITSIDGNTSCHGSDNNGLIAASLCQTGSQCPGDSTATAQCQNIKGYSGANWVLLTPETISMIRPGDNLNFCATGTASSGSFDKARFTINNVQQTETTTKRPNSNDFCQSYIVPAGTTSFKITAELHHLTLGWK